MCGKPPARFHLLEKSHFSPWTPLLLIVSSLLVLGCIESAILLEMGHQSRRIFFNQMKTWVQNVTPKTCKSLWILFSIDCPSRNGQCPNICFEKVVKTWLATRKTEANPPEPSFFTILYSSFTCGKKCPAYPTLLSRLEIVFPFYMFSSFTSVMGLASTSPGGGGILIVN